MRTVTTKPEQLQPSAESSSYLFDDWFDPIEAGLRERVRESDAPQTAYDLAP